MRASNTGIYRASIQVDLLEYSLYPTYSIFSECTHERGHIGERRTHASSLYQGDKYYDVREGARIPRLPNLWACRKRGRHGMLWIVKIGLNLGICVR